MPMPGTPGFSETVHLTVRFDHTGTVLHYQANRAAAEELAAAMTAHKIAHVSIDTMIGPSLAPLPCGTLWF